MTQNVTYFKLEIFLKYSSSVQYVSVPANRVASWSFLHRPHFWFWNSKPMSFELGCPQLQLRYQLLSWFPRGPGQGWLWTKLMVFRRPYKDCPCNQSKMDGLKMVDTLATWRPILKFCKSVLDIFFWYHFLVRRYPNLFFELDYFLFRIHICCLSGITELVPCSLGSIESILNKADRVRWSLLLKRSSSRFG